MHTELRPDVQAGVGQIGLAVMLLGPGASCPEFKVASSAAK